MPSIFRQAVNHLLARRTITPSQRDELEAEPISREEQHSTAIGNAPAVPHACLDAIHEPVIVFVRLAYTVAGTVRKTVILHASGAFSTTCILSIVGDGKSLHSIVFRYRRKQLCKMGHIVTESTASRISGKRT